FENKRDRGNPLIEPHESYHSSSKIQPGKNLSHTDKDHEYERARTDENEEKDDDIGNQKNHKHEHVHLHDSKLSGRNDNTLYDREVYSEKEKDRSKNSRKRARSSSIQQSDSYYSQSEALHTDTSPHPSLPPVMASPPNRSALSEHITSVRHEPRSPLFYSDIPQSSPRMARKNYYNDEMGSSTR
ncbi:919_t:CDS:2, partial [Cetraspora pellucida]